MKHTFARANSFKRSFKKIKLTDEENATYIKVVYELLGGIELDKKYKDHPLKGNRKNTRECHIKPDLLLIYQIDNNVLKLIDIGSHSDLFK